MANEELDTLTKWPTKREDMSVDLLMRIVGADTQREWRRKWDGIDSDKDYMRSPLFRSQTLSIISAVGLLACLWALRESDPSKAEEFARDYWEMCEAGDSFGELLWDFTEKAGLNPELIEKAMACDAVAKASD